MRKWSGVVFVSALVCGGPGGLLGQEPSDEPGLVSLFFDCQAPNCRDQDYFRRELPFVNWVLDREVADVHVLVTSQQTGGGGRLYTLAFIGRGRFEGEEQELSLATRADATTDDERSAIADRTRLGLVPYVQDTPVGGDLRVTYEGAPRGGPGGGPGTASPQDDPWNFWVFSVGANGFVNGESTSQFRTVQLNTEASRTTETWKYSVEGSFFQEVQKFEFVDSDSVLQKVEETIEDWEANALVVRSLGGQWSAGVRADVGSSTRLNQDLRWSLKPGVEYNFFPYEESTRRSLTLQYLVGPAYFAYTDTTIFDQTSETRAQHSLTGRLALVQPWGRWATSVTGQQYLHDVSKYGVDVFMSFNVRLFRGFSVRMTGSYAWIRDQLYLPKSGATEAEVLLRQRQLETSYRYFTSFGIEYRFGSIFNNVVNPRFGGSGGGFFFF
jgi:hypothetical protein